MKSRSILLSVVVILGAFVVVEFWNYLHAPTNGPPSQSDLGLLTNAVLKITTDRITSIAVVDVSPLLTRVSTDSVTNAHDYFFERSRLGWRLVASRRWVE